MLLCTQTVAMDHEVIITRRYGNHHPTVWGDHFLIYVDLPRANEGEEKQHEDLKEEVRKMLVMAPSKSLHKLDLINTIQLLGVAYHFEHEIEESLSCMYPHYEEWIGDLHDIALCFRLLRQLMWWNIDASTQLPSYMKILYCHLLDVYKEIEKELANENQSILVDYSIIEIKKVLRAYFQEAKWYYNEKEVPRTEQYMKNGIPSSGYLLLATTSWLAMGNITTKDVFDWIATEPPILVASCCITRLLNDLSSHEV
ncbi:hypothetical protein MTR67_044837 [Solanum verrucosum]|uniref:Uncharacterized protein n=1 Tax=Solanum verrucosum TaxID=315347 RepID=A0AAF0ZT86_SOLVR|nr:hypothetical protein MTR67_044837 [Solanum verrucosum]